MKKQSVVIFAVLGVVLLATGFIVYKSIFTARKTPQTRVEEEVFEQLPQVDASVVVRVTKSTAKDNAIVMKVSGLGGKMDSVGYELTYDTQGLIKGVNSGGKPIDTTGKEEFDREIYLGTCSRNVCKPDTGVTKVSIVLEFIDKAGKKSQFSHDYDL